jgi:transcriptional regulator with XRE-family HTH domain
MNFREALRKFREGKKMKVRELSEKSGVSASYISMIENGLLTNYPSGKVINKLEAGLDLESGALGGLAPTGSTVAIQKICLVPKDAEKLNRILSKLSNDKTKLDKVLKAIED